MECWNRDSNGTVKVEVVEALGIKYSRRTRDYRLIKTVAQA